MIAPRGRGQSGNGAAMAVTAVRPPDQTVRTSPTRPEDDRRTAAYREADRHIRQGS